MEEKLYLYGLKEPIMAKLSDEWWTAPAEGEHGGLIMVTGRRDIDKLRLSGKYNYRVEVTWTYEGDGQGMPQRDTAKIMEQVHDSLLEEFADGKVAVVTGVYTGEGERNWVFYTRNLPLFQKLFNRSLQSFDQLPLEFYAEEDPNWEEYELMSQNEVTGSD